MLTVFAAAISVQAQEPLGFDPFPRRPVDTTRLGVNAFVNEPRFGTINAQFLEVRDTLKLKYVRVLFVWSEVVQPTRTSRLNFSLYDQIVKNLPRGVEAFAVLTNVPSWMSQPENWIDGNPRKTFAELFVKKIARRYRRYRKFKGIQVWNEPTMPNPENQVLDVQSSPANYVELMRFAHAAIRKAAPRKLIISGATTPIDHNYPETLEYNETLAALGMQDLVDVWGIHYYGTHYENLYRPHNLVEFLNSLTKPVWITEIGERGINEQQGYFERIIPLVMDLVPGIERAYIYQFTEDAPAESTYGLRNLTPGFELSDFYIYLRDRAVEQK